MKGSGVTLAVLGAVNWDVTLFEEDFASPGEEVPVLRIEEGPGGKGANVAVAAARLLGWGRVAFIGAVGDDDVGAQLRRGLEAEGVLADGLVALGGRRSGSAHIVVDSSGNKSIHSHFAANDGVRPEHVAGHRGRHLISAASEVVLMDLPLPAARKAARLAKEAGARLTYSPGVRGAAGYEGLSSILRLADDVVLDRNELLRLEGADDPREGVASMLRRFPRLTVVATTGPAGCLVGGRGSVVRVPPFRLEVLGLRAVNSAGSGDAFLAAYVCYSDGRRPAEAARWGNLAGALKAADPATRGSPSRKVLEETMTRASRIRRLPPG